MPKSSKTTKVPKGVTTTKVNPLVWAKALELCGGNRKRIKIISHAEVLIVN